MYVYFFHFPKKHMEHRKLRKILQRKGLKILCNIKIWLISMLGNCCPIYKGLVYMCIKETHKRTWKMSPIHDLMNAIGIFIFNIRRYLMQKWHFFHHLVVFKNKIFHPKGISTYGFLVVGLLDLGFNFIIIIILL